MKNSLHFIFALGLVLCCAFIVGCPSKTTSPENPPANSSENSAENPTETAKMLTAYNPEEYAGKVLVLDFWATWCPPCRREIAETIIPMYAKYHDAGLEILGISCDKEAETVLKYAQDNGITWNQILDSDARTPDGILLSERYGVEYIPFPILINRKGKIVAMDLRGNDLVAAVKAELEKTEDAAETEIEQNEAAAETQTEQKETDAEVKAGEDEAPAETEAEEIEAPAETEVE
ncbi:MAG: TlpA family protein disulfide reductase [Thermoguttaceae bacterium]|nr:TlpA family protein disulfide reductase [Thermoguttaceae bacterium]